MNKALLLNDTTRESGHLGCLLTIQNINKACREAGIEIIDYDPVINGEFDETNLRDRLAKCDLVIVNGEGSLHHNAALTLFKKCEIAKDLGKNVFLINSVWQANSRTREFLDLFSLIFVRESFSLQELRQDGHNRGLAVPDMIFYAPPKRPNPNIKKINSDGLVIDSVIRSATLDLAKLALRKKIPLRFMGRWHKRNFLRHHPLTYTLLYLAKGDAPELLDTPKTIADSSFLISGRYHGVCLAMIYGTPFIAVASNTHKIEGLLADANLNPSVHLLKNSDLSVTTADGALEQLKNLDKHAFHESVENFVCRAQKPIQEMFSAIAQF